MVHVPVTRVAGGSSTLRIGQLAKAAGLSPDTLRHYERLGLLPPAARTSGGFRKYPASSLRRITVIQRALAIGFSLAELAGIFRERAAGRTPCQRVRALAGAKLDRLGAQVVALGRLQSALAGILVAWDARLATTPIGRPAGLLDALADLPEEPALTTVGPAPPRRRRGR